MPNKRIRKKWAKRSITPGPITFTLGDPRGVFYDLFDEDKARAMTEAALRQRDLLVRARRLTQDVVIDHDAPIDGDTVLKET